MEFPKDYSFDLTDTRRNLYFPNLRTGENFIFSSLKNDEYNCVAWSLKNDQEFFHQLT